MTQKRDGGNTIIVDDSHAIRLLHTRSAQERSARVAHHSVRFPIVLASSARRAPDGHHLTASAAPELPPAPKHLGSVPRKWLEELSALQPIAEARAFANAARLDREQGSDGKRLQLAPREDGPALQLRPRHELAQPPRDAQLAAVLSD
mmetsp:Transcript_42321/g.130635  ORF Transcript_42321/g.130635 Transcript_42321/m.130635 type:complete len:148 (-) Transcript_42321:213-656(-)